MPATPPELSIDELKPTGVLSRVRFAKHVWTKCYVSVQAALADTMMLGMLDDVSHSMDSYRSDPNDWNLFALLHPAFEEQILRDHGWELMANGYVN